MYRVILSPDPVTAVMKARIIERPINRGLSIGAVVMRLRIEDCDVTMRGL